MQMQMTDIDWRLPIAEKMEEKEAQKQLQSDLHQKFESLVVASHVLKAVEKFKGLLHHREPVEEQLPPEEKKRRAVEAAQVLSVTSPFSFLPGAVRRRLAAKAQLLTFKEGDLITRQKSKDRQVYLLKDGQVMAVDITGPLPRFLQYYSAPAYFGDWESLFDVPERMAELVAGSDVVVYAIQDTDFLDLLSYQSFKYVLIRTLRNKQKLFSSINGFITHIADSVTTKRVDFLSTLELYRKLKPAIHSKMEADEIDTGGWAYAMRRLPENVTQTFVFLLSSSIPDVYLHPGFLSNMVPTVGRRRAVFKLGDGKSLVLIRDDYTDVIDFLSMLCLHAIEARKLRQRIASPHSFRIIQDFVLSKAKQVQALLEREQEQLRRRLQRIESYRSSGQIPTRPTPAQPAIASVPHVDEQHNAQAQQHHAAHHKRTISQAIKETLHLPHASGKEASPQAHAAKAEAPGASQSGHSREPSPRSQNKEAAKEPSPHSAQAQALAQAQAQAQSQPQAQEGGSDSSKREDESLAHGFPLSPFMHPKKESADEQDAILAQLPFSEKEKAGLKAMWPDDLVHRIWDMIIHHEDYNISVNLSTQWVSDANERWTRLVQEAAVKLMGQFDCHTVRQPEKIEQHCSLYRQEDYACSRTADSPTSSNEAAPKADHEKPRKSKSKSSKSPLDERQAAAKQHEKHEAEHKRAKRSNSANDVSTAGRQAVDDNSHKDDLWADDEEEEIELEVDIISSNTHSVINCVSPYLHRQRAEIMAWAARETPVPHIDQLDLNEDDKFYVLSYYYFKAFPDRMLEREEEERRGGLVTIKETEFTGIQVNLIDLDKLDPACIDSSLREILQRSSEQHEHEEDGAKGKPSRPRKRRLLINIDYAFGRQAGDVLCCLILLFGHAIRSVNVLGKAGGLQGKRGDIILATHLILQEDDSVTEIRNEGLSVQNLRALAGGRSVWPGGVLTVPGTLLQDRNLLHFYQRLWSCVSLEMEGSYYAGQVNKYKKLAFLRDNLAMRFLYYVSDLPLHTESNLSQAMRVDEGLPPLYATTRAVLQQILQR